LSTCRQPVATIEDEAAGAVVFNCPRCGYLVNGQRDNEGVLPILGRTALQAFDHSYNLQGGFGSTFVHRFNHDRPHQALDMCTPASRDAPSTRPYQGLEELDYPFHDWTAVITTCGRICYQSRKINVSQVFAGQKVGVKQVDEHIWLVTFMHYDLGYFDDETCRREPIDNPFGPNLLPMSPE
jgi:hypothetical protein